jgi:hypothetical protein
VHAEFLKPVHASKRMGSKVSPSMKQSFSHGRGKNDQKRGLRSSREQENL